MAHRFSTVDYVAMETLRQFVHRSEVFAAMKHDHEEEFKKSFAVGDTVRVKFPWQPVIRDGMSYVGQNIERIETTVTADQPFGIDFDIDTIDKLLNMERGEERVRKEYLEPAGKYLAAEADRRAAEFAADNAGNVFGILQTNPATFDATSAAARQRFAELESLEDDMSLFVPPAVMRAIKGGSDGNLARFGPVDEIKRLYKKGIVGMADGFEWSESMSLKTHTAGTWAGAVSLASAVANGANELAVTCTSGDTFRKGDKIGIANVFRVNRFTRQTTEVVNTKSVTVAANVTATSTSATIPIVEKLYFSGSYQNISAQPAASAALTLFPGTTSPNGKSGKLGLVFGKSAFAGISLPLPMPGDSVEMARQFTDPDTGISLSYIRDFDTKERKWMNRFDVLLGFGVLHADTNAGVICCA